MEGREALLDGLLVVVGAPRRLGAVQQALGHARVGDVKVQNLREGPSIYDFHLLTVVA